MQMQCVCINYFSSPYRSGFPVSSTSKKVDHNLFALGMYVCMYVRKIPPSYLLTCSVKEILGYPKTGWHTYIRTLRVVLSTQLLSPTYLPASLLKVPTYLG